LLLTWLGLRRAPRLAMLPALALWVAAGCWCAQMEPPVATQQALRSFADGLSREVRGTVVRLRRQPPAAPDPAAPQTPPEDDAWELDSAPATQSVDLAVQAVESVTPDRSTMQPTPGGVRILLSGPPLPLRCGDTLTVPLRLRTPDAYRTPGAFSYADQLLGEGIGTLATVPSARVRVTRPAASAPTTAALRCGLYAAQAWAAGRLEAFAGSAANRALPRPARLTQEDAALLNAMLFGDRSRLTQQLRTAFERTGTFHLFVVSGLHVALLAGLLFGLLRRLLLPEGAAVALTLAGTAAYTLLTGFGVPAQRALLMTSVYLTARWLDRRLAPLQALGAAALVVLALQPRALFEPSFQMTFLVIVAVAGIAGPVVERLLAPRLRALQSLDTLELDAHLHPALAALRVRLRMACELCGDLLGQRLHALPAWLLGGMLRVAEALVVAVAAELCMALPMAVYFHRATVLALPLNLLDIPLLAAVLCCAVPLFLCSLFLSSPLGAWLAAVPGAVTALLLHAMRLSVGSLQHLPLADLRTPAPLPGAVALACAAAALACLLLRSRRHWLAATGLATALLVPVAALWPTPPRLHPGVLEVTALDVGQGDSLLVVSPSGHTLLVEGGGPVGRGPLLPVSHFDLGEQVVAPYLWSRHIRRLDAVLLTHAHSDHMGGLPAVLRDLRPRVLWYSIEPGNAPGLRALLAEAATLGVRVERLEAGDRFDWAGLEASVLAPEPGYANPGPALNNDSLVLRLDYGRASVLLEGDAEAPSEAAMLAHGRIAPATLLKVGHHGSRTSTQPAFLAAVAPREAVISVGRHNTFGHPRAEVLARLEAAHVRTFRTDRAGSETFLLTPDGGISAISTAPR